MPHEPLKLTEHELKHYSTRDLIRLAGGWHEGHYVFRTGEHGNGYIDKMGFLRFPTIMDEIGDRLAQQCSDITNDIDIVVGPSIIGAIIACATARKLNVPYSVTYRDSNDQAIYFHRGFVPDPDTRILFVDDFIFSGQELGDNVQAMQNAGMIVLGASVIGVRPTSRSPIPIRSLLTLEFTKSSEEHCGMCQNGIPITATNIRE